MLPTQQELVSELLVCVTVSHVSLQRLSLFLSFVSGVSLLKQEPEQIFEKVYPLPQFS